MPYHDGEFVDMLPIGVQTLVGFCVVLVDGGFGGQEFRLPGFDVAEFASVRRLCTR